LEQSIAAERNQELAALPAQFGFPDAASFIAAVKAATGARRGRRPKAKSAGQARATTGKRRKRAKITDATRAEVKKLVEAGKSGTEIAKAVGISLPSVQNVKAQLGLVKKRK
ncbi:MAG: helix-turn-helix domain-containing protein, partial [Opitutaceae bacterium]